MALEDVTNAAASSSRSKETTKAVRWSTKTDSVILNKVLEEEILKPPAYFEPQTTRGNTRAERDVFRTSSERRNDARAKMDVIAKKVMDLGVHKDLCSGKSFADRVTSHLSKLGVDGLTPGSSLMAFPSEAREIVERMCVNHVQETDLQVEREVIFQNQVEEIETAVDACMEGLTNRYSESMVDFSAWSEAAHGELKEIFSRAQRVEIPSGCEERARELLVRISQDKKTLLRSNVAESWVKEVYVESASSGDMIDLFTETRSNVQVVPETPMFESIPNEGDDFDEDTEPPRKQQRLTPTNTLGVADAFLNDDEKHRIGIRWLRNQKNRIIALCKRLQETAERTLNRAKIKELPRVAWCMIWHDGKVAASESDVWTKDDGFALAYFKYYENVKLSLRESKMVKTFMMFQRIVMGERASFDTCVDRSDATPVARSETAPAAMPASDETLRDGARVDVCAPEPLLDEEDLALIARL